MTPEAALTRDVLRALGGRSDLILHKNPVGAGFYRQALGEVLALPLPAVSRKLIRDTLARHSLTYGLCPGSADLIAIVAPTGRLVAPELKSERGRLRPEQEAWGARVRALGGVSGVARTVEDVEALLEKGRGGAEMGSREQVLLEENARLYALTERQREEIAALRERMMGAER